MLVVLLTGGIGSGKSAAADHFARLGAPVIDADQIAREVVKPGSPALYEIHSVFGPGVLTVEGGLAREHLRDIVFADPQSRRKLESITHPRIRALMEQRLSALETPYAVLVIPLLLETGQTELGDRVLVVDVPESLQIERVQHRDGLTEAQIRNILAAQCSRADRLAAADDVIDNRGDLSKLHAQVEHLHEQYLRLTDKLDSTEFSD